MRIRAVVAIGLLILPAGLSAQHIPLPGVGRRGPRPAPLPPQPPALARELAYRRLPISVESYPLISFVQSPGYAVDGLVSSWTTFGMGTRADYRVTSTLSATMDMTSSLLGGPALMQSVEIGARLRPDWSERRVYPFLDVRLGYLSAYNRALGSIDDVYDSYFGREYGSGPRYSRGFGGVGGAGLEYLLTRRFSLTTGATVMRTHMRALGLVDEETTPTRFAMTSFRYTMGIKFNPVRTIKSGEAGRP